MNPTWRGDMSDDCTAIWRGLMLRAEQMSRRHWWWAVYADEGRAGCDEIAASHDEPPYRAKTGHEARAAAEAAARKYLARQPR